MWPINGDTMRALALNALDQQNKMYKNMLAAQQNQLSSIGSYHDPNQAAIRASLAKTKRKPDTFREELQGDVDKWLEDIEL